MLFLPQDITHPNIRTQLNASIARATALRACIAYWTIPPTFLHPNFRKLLAQEHSFCCVDLQLPTDIDHLAHFHALKAHNFLLHCRRLKTNDKYHSTNRLLHTKLLLLDFPDGAAEIWIGSHNFTAAALTGLNLEASMVIPCPQGSPLYEQVGAYLEHIRGKCHPFDLARLADYRALQGIPDDTPNSDELYEVLDLITDNIPALTGKTVLLLGDDIRELKRFEVAGTGGGRPSLVEVADRQTGHTRLLRAAVQSSGYIKGASASSYGITFTPRPYALRRGGLPAFVNVRAQEFGQTELRQFKYWVNLELTELLPESAYLLPPTPRPQRAKWVPDPAATHQMRLEPGYPDLLLADGQALSERAHQLYSTRQPPVVEQPDFLAPHYEQAQQVVDFAGYRTLEQELQQVSLSDVQAFYEEWFQRRFFSPEAQRGALTLSDYEDSIPERLKVFKRKLLQQQQLRFYS